MQPHFTVGIHGAGTGKRVKANFQILYESGIAGSSAICTGMDMIREIQEKDIAECVDVIRRSFLTVADELGYTAENAPRFTAFATTKDRLRYQSETEHRPMYAYYDGDKIIGYYSLALQEDGECELNNLCVLPQYRHRRIGKELLEDAYRKAKEIGCKTMKIGIVEENIVLRKWYEENGFVHVGTKKFDFFPFTCGYMKRDL